jgi:hypothetical protein
LVGDPSLVAAVLPAAAAELTVGAVGKLEPELVLLLAAGVLAVVLAAAVVVLEDAAALLVLLLLLLLPQPATIRAAAANAHAANLPRLNNDSILGPPKFVCSLPIKRLVVRIGDFTTTRGVCQGFEAARARNGG